MNTRTFKTGTRALALAILAVTSFALAAPAQAQSKADTPTGSNTLKIGGGGGAKNGSTYSRMLGDLAGFCSTDDLKLIEVEAKGGGAENLTNLQGNTINAGVVQTDMMVKAKAENATAVANIKTLFTLHPETVHLIARGDAKKEGGWGVGSMKFNQDTVSFTTIESLKGRPIGAVGGTVSTLQVISEFLHLDWKTHQYNSTEDMKIGLAKGEVDAVLIVAGAPSDAVKKIPASFRLIAIRPNGDLMGTGAYKQTKVQYANLNNNAPVDTISTQALLVTRTYSSAAMKAKLASLRQCFKTHLDEIKDQDGSHPAWQSVDASDQGVWAYYDLPAVTTVATTTGRK